MKVKTYLIVDSAIDAGTGTLATGTRHSSRRAILLLDWPKMTKKIALAYLLLAAVEDNEWSLRAIG